MRAPVVGFRFHVEWGATSYTVIRNGTNLEHVRERIGLWAARRGAWRVSYLGETRPLPKEPKRIPHKVF